jgi:hypothetical protein
VPLAFLDAILLNPQELLKRPWLNPKDDMASMIGIPTDHVLPDDPELAPMIEASLVSAALGGLGGRCP